MAHVVNMLTLHNLRERGVELPDELDDGVGYFSDRLKKMLDATGDFHWRQERDCFNKCWTSLACRSKEKMQNLSTTYEDLADGVTDLITSGNLPELVKAKEPEIQNDPVPVAPVVAEEPVEEEKVAEPEPAAEEEVECINAEDLPGENDPVPEETAEEVKTEGENGERGGRGRGRGGNRGANRGEYRGRGE